MSEPIIVAQATPVGAGAIGIIRLSGAGCLALVSTLFSPQKGAPLSARKSHTLTLGTLRDPQSGHSVDRCLAAVMRAPNSYTGEDSVELHCHGGVLLLDAVLELCLKSGARLATPGEFSRRAFLNGKLDLMGAQAVCDAIYAKSDSARRLASAKLGGGLSQQMAAVRAELVAMGAQLLAQVEYPDEEELQAPLFEQMSKTIGNTLAKLNKLYSTFAAGRAINEGLTTAIIGKPNVGKSSLLNCLAGAPRAIVTPIAGTTRDIVTHSVALGRLLLRLHDTAGQHTSEDPVELLGIEQAQRAMAECELLLLVLDGSRPLDADDERLLQAADPARTQLLLNKADLPQKIDLGEYLSKFQQPVSFCAADGSGLQALGAALDARFLQQAVGLDGGEMLTARWQHEAIGHAIEALSRAQQALDVTGDCDLASLDLSEACQALGELLGESASKSMIDEMFSRFCLGK